MEITEANLADCEVLLALQRQAYQSEAELHQDHDIPPLTQTLEEFKAAFQTRIVLKVVEDGEILGSGQAHFDGHTIYLGRMAVWPQAQGRGIGTMLMSALEGINSEAKRIELFTGENSDANLAMYKRRGYKIFKQAKLGKTTVLFLEKRL